MSVESEVQEFVTAFGKRIKELRAERGLAQIDLAAKAEMKERQIQRIEAGTVKTSLGHVYLLAKGLEITISQLFEDMG